MRPAGFWIRFVASIVDAVVCMIPAFIIASFLNADERTVTNAVQFFYGLFLPFFWSGYTLGKRMFRIQIVRIDGEEITLWTMIRRVLVASFLYLLTFGIGLIVSAFMVGLREDKRSLHDLIAGTRVEYR